ncbi:hypothetical protein [Rhizobium sp. LjRoot254]|uniref:hypothetical protein n=1 Tax=Rhizobium sp. LjRoot254 TaxID=3342297 RepID=UPI003ED117AF
MNMKLIVASCAALMLAGCQTGDPNGPQATKTKTWTQFAPGDVLEIADAKCRMQSNSVAQGMYAQGSPGFVAGAQLGNAIGNAIAMEQFYKQCMTISGWKQITVVKAAPPRPAKVKAVKP